MAMVTAAKMQTVNRYPLSEGTLDKPTANEMVQTTTKKPQPAKYPATKQPIKPNKHAPDKYRQIR
jgi:hypothetical protein